MMKQSDELIAHFEKQCHLNDLSYTPQILHILSSNINKQLTLDEKRYWEIQEWSKVYAKIQKISKSLDGKYLYIKYTKSQERKLISLVKHLTIYFPKNDDGETKSEFLSKGKYNKHNFVKNYKNNFSYKKQSFLWRWICLTSLELIAIF